MKFNLQLKKALENYEKTMAVKSCPQPADVQPDPEEQKPFKVCVRPIEKVVGGEIIWKPIDRASAMLLARAPWWAQPPAVPAPPPQPPKIQPSKPKPKKIMSLLKYESVPAMGIQDSNATQVRNKTDQEMTDELVEKTYKETGKTLDKTGKLLDQAIDARAALDSLCSTWKESWLDFIDTSDARLRELRMTRMAMETEIRQMMAGFREVRTFFLDKDHDKEVARLKEFVDICERLKKLKDEGFLDSVADTMIKLA